MFMFHGDIIKKIAIGMIAYTIYNLSAYLILIPLFLSDGMPDWVLSLIERSRFIAVFIMLELISRRCAGLGGSKSLERKNRAFAALRHDIKTHFLILKGLLAQGENGDAIRYLERMSKAGELSEPVIATGNSAVDAVLNEKYNQAIGLNIDFQCDLKIPETIQLDSFDVCVIFGNAIDNAIESCQKSTAALFIHIQSGVVKSYLVVEIKNSLIAQNLTLTTDKAVPELHGIGLQNIYAVVKKCGGVMNITQEENVFVLSLMLPI